MGREQVVVRFLRPIFSILDVNEGNLSSHLRVVTVGRINLFFKKFLGNQKMSRRFADIRGNPSISNKFQRLFAQNFCLNNFYFFYWNFPPF